MRREGIVGVLLVPVLFFLSIQCNNTENIDREKSVSGAIEISAEQKTDISDEPVHGGELIITSGAGSPKL